jgi:phage-related minor tail protein
MALTVGELTGYISLDAADVDRGVAQAGQAMTRLQGQMTTDGERAGEAAGDGLGEGITRGADGRLRDARGRFLQAGRTLGDAAGDGLADGVADGVAEAVNEAEGGMSRLQQIALGAGLAAGAALMAGMGQVMEQSQITGRLGAQLGATPAEAERYGKIAGQLYAKAITQDFQTAADAISATMRAGLLPTGATDAQIGSIAGKVSMLADTFELDLAQAANAVGQMMKTGLAPNAQIALDTITRGLQVMGPRADDIADTFNEYSTIFRQLGISATDATGIMAQGLKAGARDTDVVADSLKEFVLITQGGGEEVDKAFKKIGLSGSAMQSAFSKGGPQAKAALDQMFDGLRSVKDPADRSAIALTLFGTKAEDMQRALFSIDPSKAAASLGQVGGAADKMGASLSNNSGHNLEAFKRGVSQAFVNVLGGQVIPVLMKAGRWMQEHSNEVKIAAGVVAGTLIPVLILMGVNATIAGTRVAAGWAMSGASAIKSAAIQTAAGVRVVGGWIAQGAAATLQGARVALAWTMTGGRAVAGAAMQVAAGARVVAGWVLMGVQSMIQGARMAAAWLIAMGPVGWVIAAIVGLVALIVANWDTVKRWTGQAWDWIWQKVQGAVNMVLAGVAWLSAIPGKISAWFGQAKDWAILKLVQLVIWAQGLPGRLIGAISSLAGRLANSASTAWERFKSAAILKAVQLVVWVSGLPGRISAGIGNLTSLLVEKGRNVVQGLWNGIQAMGGWLKDQIAGWARSTIPGPIASALGIASPSKVTAAQGRWIARGLIVGMTGSAKQVKAASTKLADIVRDAMSPGKARTRALSIIATRTKQLTAMAVKEATLGSKLKAAQKNYTALISARNKLSADVRKGVLDGANITANQGGGPVTALSILSTLTQKAEQARQFAADLAALKVRGVSADLIAQIAQAGVENGSASAAALANANGAQIRAINQQQKNLAAAAGQAGNVAGNAMYGTGIQAAQGLIKGLQSQRSAIERQMLAIAKGMSAAIRKALGIRSPSRVMAEVGRYIPAGIVEGIRKGTPAVDRSMANLVSTPAVTVPPWEVTASSGRGRRGDARVTTVLELRSSGRRTDDLLLNLVRPAIRIRGGDAQAVLAGG